jgi:virginiamycin B lyase
MSRHKTLSLAAAILFLASVAPAATVTGVVRGPDGAPFRGAKVKAQNSKTKMSVIVFSDSDGHYKVPELPAGDYEVQATAIGFASDPKSGVFLNASQDQTLDWDMQKQMVKWEDIPIYQGIQLMPDGKGKARFVQTCGASCHGFRSMIGVQRDLKGWQEAVADQRTRIGGGVINQIKDDQDASDLSAWLAKTFGTGPGAVTESPADMPGYKDLVQNFTDEGLKIVYVTYEMPAGRMTWDVTPDKQGNVWAPYFGTANGVGKLNPETGELKEYLLPSQNPRVGTRSAYVGPDGTLWLVIETGTVVKIDQKSGKMTMLPAPDEKGRSMNTVRVDPKGTVWFSGGPKSWRLDPKTNKFTPVTETSTYAANFDQFYNIWFTEAGGAGRVFKVDDKTEKVSAWTPPTPGNRRRIQVDSHGIVWFAEFTAGKIGRLDPETGVTKEITLPGAQPAPYAIGLDKDGVWYGSGMMDTVGRIDPDTLKVTEYPVPEMGNGMREINNDTKGHMWFASPGDNFVGYMYLAK